MNGQFSARITAVTAGQVQPIHRVQPRLSRVTSARARGRWRRGRDG